MVNHYFLILFYFWHVENIAQFFSTVFVLYIYIYDVLINLVIGFIFLYEYMLVFYSMMYCPLRHLFTCTL